VRQFLAIVLLAFLPIQFSWAAVASYCGHEAQAGAGHFGHHANAGSVSEPVVDPDANPAANEDGKGDKAPGAVDPDCGHCHGYCSVMLTLPSDLPSALKMTPPSTTRDEAGGSHAPTRPERPQWLPLA
jgi:hypothetical protein